MELSERDTAEAETSLGALRRQLELSYQQWSPPRMPWRPLHTEKRRRRP